MKKNKPDDPLFNIGFSDERFPMSTHMCYIYNEEDERRRVISQYINQGIVSGEYTGYFASISDNRSIEEYLQEIGIKIPGDAEKERTYFAHARDVYCPGNIFTPEGMIGRLKNTHKNAADRNLPGFRASGEMAWALSKDVQGTERLIEYESRLNILEETHPFLAICQYDANRFDGATLFEVLKVHPMMIVRGQVVRNPYYIPARDYLSEKGLPTEA